jgi:hypothetical protein
MSAGSVVTGVTSTFNPQMQATAGELGEVESGSWAAAPDPSC